MRSLLALFALPVALLELVAAQSYATNIVSSETCMTQMSSTTAAPSPIPASTISTQLTSYDTIEQTVAGYTETSTVTPATKTNSYTIVIYSATATSFSGIVTVNNNAQTTVGSSDLVTVTSTLTQCAASTNATFTIASTTTVYASSSPQKKRHPNPFPSLRPKVLQRRQEPQGTLLPVSLLCTAATTTHLLTTSTVTDLSSTTTVTSTLSTSYTAVYTTRTIYITQRAASTTTVTVTHSNTALGVATVVSTVEATCGAGTTTDSSIPVSTVTLDPSCAPSAMTSAAAGEDRSIIEVDDSPNGPGAVAVTNTPDASSCCQLCMDTDGCAAMASNSKTGECRLEFTSLRCGMGVLGIGGNTEDENVGAPGTGWWIQRGCGDIET